MAHRRGLLEYIRRRVRNEHDAEDILQDVFYQLATSVNVIEPIENLTAWLYAVARNKITDWYRKRRMPTLAATRSGDPSSSELTDLLSDPEDSPYREYRRRMVWTELADALADLPHDQRSVFVWHELEGRSYREIAGMTGVPINTLISRKRYAVLGLRDRLRDLYEEFDTL